MENVPGPLVKRLAGAVRSALFRALERFRIGDQTFHILLASVIGTLSGLGAVAFLLMIRLVRHLFFGILYPATGSNPYLLCLLPALGGLVIGPLVRAFPTEAKGDGIPYAMESASLRGGIIRPRTVALRTLTSAITIGSGGSVGREAPIGQIGAAVGSSVGQLLKVSGERMRSLLACGAAGGIAAVFNAPVGGVFFTLEVILGDFSTQTFAPIVVSSVMATAVSRMLLGNVLIFTVPPFRLDSLQQVGLCVFLGALCGAVAVLFMKSLSTAEKRFDASPVPLWLRPALGGLLTGVVAVGFPQVLGTDESSLNQAVHGGVPTLLLLAIVAMKLLATSSSLGSGGSGGVLGPSLFIGGLLGAALGDAANFWFPGSSGAAGGYALVGMAAFLAPVVGAPLTAVLMLFEMTGDYAVILPLLAAVTISMLVAHRFQRHSLYTMKLHEKGLDLSTGREEGVLRSLTVGQVMREEVRSVPPGATFGQLRDHFFGGNVEYLYVVEEGGRLTGVISFMDLRPYLLEPALAGVVVARDVATEGPVFVTPEENLRDSLVKFGYKNVSYLPVVDDPHRRTLIGVLRRDDLLDVYRKRIVRPDGPEG
jgi:CIC family chloride channel protein